MTNKKNAVLITAIVLLVVLLSGMILSTVLLANKKNPTWEYVVDEEKIEYYADESEYSFQCALSFKEAFKNYLKVGLLKYMNWDEEIDILTTNIIQAMSYARIPAKKLEVLATVLRENTIYELTDRYLSVVDKYGSFVAWAEASATNMEDVSSFYILSSFISSFLEITTLTEDELAKIVYYYLVTYASEEYIQNLLSFSKDIFVSLISDTFFIMRSIYKSQNVSDLSYTMDTLRSALYQLGSIYLSVNSVSDSLVNFASILGFPNKASSIIKEEDMGTYEDKYNDVLPSFSGTLSVIGATLTNIDVETVSAYYNYIYYKKLSDEYYDSIEEKILNLTVTEDDLMIYNEKVYEANKYKIFTYQEIAHISLQSIQTVKEYQNFSLNEYIEYLATVSQGLLTISTYLSNSVNFSDELYINTMDEINTCKQEAKEGFNYYLNKNYSLEDINNMDKSSEEYQEIVTNAKKMEKFFTLITGYGNNTIDLWLQIRLHQQSEKTNND